MRELNAEENLLISGGDLNSDGSIIYNIIDDGYSCRWVGVEPGLQTVGGFHIGLWEVTTMAGVLVAAYTIYATSVIYNGVANVASDVANQWNSVAQQFGNWLENRAGRPADRR